VVEQEQRDRSKAKAATGKQFTGTYFDMDPEGHWEFKNNISLVKYLESPDAFIFPSSDPAATLPQAAASAATAPAAATGSSSPRDTNATNSNPPTGPIIANNGENKEKGSTFTIVWSGEDSQLVPAAADSSKTGATPSGPTTAAPTPVKRKARASSVAETPHSDPETQPEHSDIDVGGALSDGDDNIRGRISGLGVDSDTDRDLSPPPGADSGASRQRAKTLTASSITPTIATLGSRTSKNVHFDYEA